MKRHPILAALLFSCVLGCGDGGPKGTSSSGDPPDTSPPAVSGAFSWYVDITPAHSLGNGYAVAPDGRVAFAFTPVEDGTVAGEPFTHYGPGNTTPNYDALVAVIDPTGKLAWARSFATAEIETTTALAFDEAGDLYLSGIFKDNTDGLDFGNGVTVGIGPGEISSYLVKLRGTDGAALWATAITSGDSYVQPTCGFTEKELAVRGGRGALGCLFDGGDGTGAIRILTQTGMADIAAAGPDTNVIVLGFDPSTGQLAGSYVLGGADVNVRSLAITDSGGVVLGGVSEAGNVTDSAGSNPLVFTAATSCFVAALDATFKPTARRIFGGEASSNCAIGDIALAGPDRILVGGNAEGAVGLGDEGPSSGTIGFAGVLRADLLNAGAFDRFADGRVFGVATDVWGQSFVGVARQTNPAVFFRYMKRDADGNVVWSSKEYGAEDGSVFAELDAFGFGVDKAGWPTVFGVLTGGPFVFDDGPHGGADPHFFAVKFEP